MSNKKVRVRFAPSPTGGLHLGGVRTVLFNYLFAKQQGGDFILRIEDTDQTRFVAGAEEYITETLRWCGLEADEGPHKGGAFGPYRQSERKASYRQYAEQLIQNGQAYYAFDTPEELETMRQQYKTAENPSPQYSHALRSKMRNSLSLDETTVAQLLADNTPYVVRIKMPDNETVTFTDLIRGEIHFNTSQVDDKVLLKADGMPTYHLAVVVDDYLMQISHAFRGEEWLPSAPVHILLWKYLFGLDQMPQWAHLPLILGPDSSKLSKRHGSKYGFPIFAMNWTDPRTQDFTEGFRERGFLPEALVNVLALLGWNDGTEQELFSLAELVEKFDISRVSHSGAIFDFEKAKWFNHEWIKKLEVGSWELSVKALFEKEGIETGDDVTFRKVLEMVKDRCTLLNDFIPQASFFFKAPVEIDIASVQPKWNEQKQLFFAELVRAFELMQSWQHDDIEKEFKEMAAVHQIKAGELMLPLRVMLVGGKFGPHVFDIAVIIGKAATISRIKHTLQLLKA
jgi:glutamyl-tRNA synthetase